MVFTKLSMENTLGIRPDNYEAVLEPLLPEVVRCIPVLSSRHVGECAARVLKRWTIKFLGFSRKIRRLSTKIKAVLRLSNHPSHNRFVLSQYRRFLQLKVHMK